jgi:hypothetical protein
VDGVRREHIDDFQAFSSCGGRCLNKIVFAVEDANQPSSFSSERGLTPAR